MQAIEPVPHQPVLPPVVLWERFACPDAASSHSPRPGWTLPIASSPQAVVDVGLEVIGIVANHARDRHRGGRVESMRQPHRIMTRRSCWLWVLPVCLVIAVLSCGTADAADKTKVDRATKQVERGAKQVGRGNVGPGFKEMFTGIGNTIVEGAKFSGNTMGEFFKKAFGS